jgi:peptide/nickel transport system permease protein
VAIADVDVVAAAADQPVRSAEPTKSLLRRLAGHAHRNPALFISGAILVVFLILALFGSALAPQDPLKSNPGHNYEAPGASHWFGTDQSGRDVFSRIIVGTRYTLLGGFGVMAIASVGGFLLGLATAYGGGRFDRISMRVFDLLLSVPPLITAFVMVAILGPGLGPVIIGVGIGYLPAIARIIRSEAVIERSKQYIAAAEGLGYSAPRIVVGQLAPNVTSQIIVQASMNLPYAIIDIAGLSFLGFGIQPPTPDWGSMLAEGSRSINLAPWLVIFPAAAVAVLVLSWNIFGARLRHALDPRHRR